MSDTLLYLAQLESEMTVDQKVRRELHKLIIKISRTSGKVREDTITAAETYVMSTICNKPSFERPNSDRETCSFNIQNS